MRSVVAAEWLPLFDPPRNSSEPLPLWWFALLDFARSQLEVVEECPDACGLTIDQWAGLLAICEPDEYHAPRHVAYHTTTEPGTPDRIAVYEDRHDRGACLWNGRDTAVATQKFRPRGVGTYRAGARSG